MAVASGSQSISLAGSGCGGFVPTGETRDPLLAELDRIITPSKLADDAHHEAAHDDRAEMEVDW